MKYFDILNDLIEVENTYNDLDKLFEFAHEYEEIPIVSRKGREENFIKYLGVKNGNKSLVNLAFFLINNIYLYANNNINSQNFMITYPDLESDKELFGYFIPNICIINNESFDTILKKDKPNYSDVEWLFDALNELGIKDTLDLRIHKTIEFGELSTRLYLIPKFNSFIQ